MCDVADAFFAAVRTLASDAPLKQRLVVAWVDSLATLDADELPEAIRPRFELLRVAVSSARATEKESSIEVSVRKMSPADASRCATAILEMFAELVRVKATGERLETRRGVRYAGGRRFTRATLPMDVQLPAFLARREVA
jgi:hypothetical protein